MIPCEQSRPRNVGDIFNFAIKRTRQCFFGNSRPPASSPAGGLILGPPSVDERPLFSKLRLMASKNIITLVRASLPCCDVSHKTTIYFLSMRYAKKRRRNLGAYAVEVVAEGGRGRGRVPPFRLRDIFRQYVCPIASLRGGEAVSPHKSAFHHPESRRPSAGDVIEMGQWVSAHSAFCIVPTRLRG